MAITMHEIVGSPNVAVDMGNSQVTRTYHVEGSDDYNDIIAYAIDNTSGFENVNGLQLNHRKMTSCKNVGSKNDLWRVIINWTFVAYGGDLPTGQIEYLLAEPWDVDESFSTALETEETIYCKYNYTIQGVDDARPASAAVGNVVMIDSAGKQNGSMQRVVPVTTLNKSVILPYGYVSDNFVASMTQYTGGINNAAWKGYPARCVRFDGFTCNRRQDGTWQADFTFTFKPRETISAFDLNDGGDPITLPTRDGFEQPWIIHAPKVDDGAATELTPQIIGIYYAQLHNEYDFNSLFNWLLTRKSTQDRITN